MIKPTSKKQLKLAMNRMSIYVILLTAVVCFLTYCNIKLYLKRHSFHGFDKLTKDKVFAEIKRQSNRFSFIKPPPDYVVQHRVEQHTIEEYRINQKEKTIELNFIREIVESINGKKDFLNPFRIINPKGLNRFKFPRTSFRSFKPTAKTVIPEHETDGSILDTRRNNALKTKREKISKRVAKKYTTKSSCPINAPVHKSIFYTKANDEYTRDLTSTLLLYARKYNLTICMKVENGNGKYGGDRLIKLKEDKCDVMAGEFSYSSKLIDSEMSDNVFVLSSVMDPVRHFLWLYENYDTHQLVEKVIGKKLDQWEAVMLFFNNYNIIKKVAKSNGKRIIQPNIQLQNLGLMDNATIDDIDSRWNKTNFIMVTEMFDESMLVLRDKLCCAFEDVYYLKQEETNNDKLKSGVKLNAEKSVKTTTENVNKKFKMSSKKTDVANEIRDAIVQFNRKDMYLYKLAVRNLYNEMLNHATFEEVLCIYHYELKKHAQECGRATYAGRQQVCQPTDAGHFDLFISRIREEEKDKLTRKMVEKDLRMK